MTKHILIIEDDMQNYQLVANLVKLEGYEPQHARTCEQGSELLDENQPCRPHMHNRARLRCFDFDTIKPSEAGRFTDF